MKVLILALLAIRALTVATYLAGELSSIQNSNPTVSYLMAYDLSILEKKNACLSSIKGQTGNDIPLAVKVFYDFMRTAYFVNLLSYDEDKNKGNNVFGSIMKTMKVDTGDISAQNPGAKKNTSCNHLDLHKIAKEKLKDFCNVNFKDIETALAAELKAANNFQKECPDKINQMFVEIEKEHKLMTTFSKQYLKEMVPILHHQFLTVAHNFFYGDYHERNRMKFVLIYEMMKFEQNRSSKTKLPLDNGPITAALEGYIKTIQEKAALKSDAGIGNLITQLKNLSEITLNTGAIKSDLETALQQYIKKNIPNIIDLL